MSSLIYSQEGEVQTERAIRVERHSLMSEYLTSKLPEFEEALEKRCDEDNEIYKALGVQDNQHLYQVDMSVYGLWAGEDAIQWRQVGVIR